MQEAGTAQTVYDWLQVHLSNHVGVTPRLDRLGLAGHSRGGKVIWSVLKLNSSGVRAVAGVDPVDSNIGNDPAVITGSFGFSFPSLIIGTGYGPDGLAACAPAGNNHVQFYEASAPLAFHIVATEYGHNDVLDDNPDGCGLTCTVCKAGDSREPMRHPDRRFAGGFFPCHLARSDRQLRPLGRRGQRPGNGDDGSQEPVGISG